jgi:chromosome segregation ATPase
MTSQIDDLQQRLESSSSKTLASDAILKGKESRIEELEKELASLREHHAKSNNDRAEAIALVESRDAQIKRLQDMLPVSSNHSVATESAPKDNSDGSSIDDKARAWKPTAPPDQLQFRTQHIPEMYSAAVLTGPSV